MERGALYMWVGSISGVNGRDLEHLETYRYHMLDQYTAICNSQPRFDFRITDSWTNC